MTTRKKPAAVTSRLQARIAELEALVASKDARIDFQERLAEAKGKGFRSVEEDFCRAAQRVAALEELVDTTRAERDRWRSQAILWRGVSLGMDYGKARAIREMTANDPPEDIKDAYRINIPLAEDIAF